jgi:PAS domain S-box-containing protein
MRPIEDHGPSVEKAQPGRLAAALARDDGDGARDHGRIDRHPGLTYTESLDDGRTMSVNPQLEAVLGCSQDEWLADPLGWMSMIHPDDRDRVLEACSEANRTGEPFRAEYRMIAVDGRILWFSDEGPGARRGRPAAVLAGRDACHHRREATR